MKQANGDIPGLDTSSGSDNEEDEDDEEEEFQGFAEPEPINQEDEYIDEDKYTTVTIESVGISRGGFSRPGDEDTEAVNKAAAAEKEAAEQAKKGEIKRDANGKRIWTKERPRTEWPKKKKKKFRYETKAERKVTRMKEGAKKRKQKEARAKKE